MVFYYFVEGGKKEYEVESEGRRLSIGFWIVWIW